MASGLLSLHVNKHEFNFIIIIIIIIIVAIVAVDSAHK
jgi:hypothetical protein